VFIIVNTQHQIHLQNLYELPQYKMSYDYLQFIVIRQKGKHRICNIVRLWVDTLPSNSHSSFTYFGPFFLAPQKPHQVELELLAT